MSHENSGLNWWLLDNNCFGDWFNDNRLSDDLLSLNGLSLSGLSVNRLLSDNFTYDDLLAHGDEGFYGSRVSIACLSSTILSADITLSTC